MSRGKHSRHPEFMGAHVAHHHIIVSEHSAKLVHDVLGRIGHEGGPASRHQTRR